MQQHRLTLTEKGRPKFSEETMRILFSVLDEKTRDFYAAGILLFAVLLQAFC